MSDTPTAHEGRTPPTRREATANATRREAPGGGRGEAPTRREGIAEPRRTRRLNLPAAIADRYEYLHDLPTAGGEADIALLRSLSTQEEVIFKSYRAGLAPDPVAMDLLRRADTRHIVRLIDLADGDDGVWEIQEYCSLGSLRDWVSARGGRLPGDVLFSVVGEVAASLKYLHDLATGVAHRDLKPANVLVRSENPLDLVLTDFGLAKAHQAFTHLTTTVKGTWHYAAPEVHSKQSSPKSDWFSLGAMVFEFYAGRKLFALADGTDVSEDDAKARSVSGNYSTDLIDDPRWRLLADGLLTWDKDHRWGAEQVESWLGGESPAVYDERTKSSRAIGYRPKWSPVLVTTPEMLAEQLRQHWDSAATELAGRPDQKMTRFLESFGYLEHAVQALDSNESPGAKLVRLQGILDPAGPIHFGEVPLNDQSLRGQIMAALGSDARALDWLEAVLNEHILTAFAEVTGATQAAKADFLLSRWLVQATETMRLLPHDYQEVARVLFRSALPVLFARALGEEIPLDSGEEARIATEMDSSPVSRSAERRRPWSRFFFSRGNREDPDPAQSRTAARKEGVENPRGSGAAGRKASEATAAPPRRPEASNAQAQTHTLTFAIPQQAIGRVIGTAGRTITQLQKQSDSRISVDDDGTVRVWARDASAAGRARQLVEAVVTPSPATSTPSAPSPKLGDRYTGTVKSLAVFGAFVSHPAGKDGLIPIRELRVLAGGARIERVEDVVHVGQQLEVQVISVKANGDFGLSIVRQPPGGLS